GIQGIAGTDGKSAYEEWIDAGNTGSEQDFLDSLKGDQGIQGIAGTDGVDGKSVYEEWIDAGNTGSEQDFLDSLKGDQGIQGIAGTDGVDGKSALEIWQSLPGNDGKDGADFIAAITGKDGKDGVTPEIGTNGNWFIGTTDTGIAAQGPQGAAGSNGTDGIDGITPEIGTNGNWFIGTTDTGIAAQGPKGDTGPQGPAGENGVVNPKDLTAGDNSITVQNGTGATIVDANVRVTDGGITTTKLANGAVTPVKIANGGANNVLTTDASGNPTWTNKSSFESIEPWNVQGTSNKATNNSDNIYQTGSVAIGVNSIPSSDANAKLYVAGDVVSTGKFYTTNSVYADYVSEKYFTGSSDLNLSYEFPTLSNIAEFVKANYHLPGVTPIGDLEKTEAGYAFDMTNLSIELLEKTEELFLHTIEQQEQIESLKSQVNDTNKRLELLEKLLLNNSKLENK